MESELQKFIALALAVVDRQIGLRFAVRRTDNIGGLVNTALELAFIATSGWIWIHRINAWIVPSLAICTVGAIRAIESV